MYMQWKVKLGNLKLQQFLLFLGYIKQLILDYCILAMLLTSIPNKSQVAADNLEFQRWPPSYDTNAPPQFFSILLGNYSNVHFNTKQIHYINKVYKELIQLKTEVHCFKNLFYNYLLSCIEQLIHYCCSIHKIYFINKRINRSQGIIVVN